MKYPIGTIIWYNNQFQFEKIKEKVWKSLTAQKLLIEKGKDPNKLESYQYIKDDEYGFRMDDEMVDIHFNFAEIVSGSRKVKQPPAWVRKL